ncbi:cupin domain-containing protein [Furfurilactobacillus sp. WILCCON 0119]
MTEKEPVFGKGALNTAYAQYFIGNSYLKSLVADDAINVNVGNVTFEPGCRNDWHIHHDGYQLLLVTDGEGWYQEEGQTPRHLTSGDVVVIHDGVKHWHGATKDHWFTHLAITTGTAEWLEPVTDEAYASLPE